MSKTTNTFLGVKVWLDSVVCVILDTLTANVRKSRRKRGRVDRWAEKNREVYNSIEPINTKKRRRKSKYGQRRKQEERVDG